MTDRPKPRSPRRKEGDSLPVTERICRVCGQPKTAHEPDCHMRPFDPPIRFPREMLQTGNGSQSQSLKVSKSPSLNFCLAPNCPTEISPEENFCAHCYSLIPEHLHGEYFNCRTNNAKLLALQGMVDTLARGPQGDQEILREALCRIKHHCLTSQDKVPPILLRIVRLCIDAGIKEHYPEIAAHYGIKEQAR